MNKYLLLSAAALLSSAAMAGEGLPPAATSIHFIGANGTSYCDGMRLRGAGNGFIVGQHTFTECGGASAIPEWGLAGRRKPLGKEVFFYEPTMSDGYIISLPLQTGGAWSLYATTNGTTIFLVNHGTYSLGPPRKGAHGSTAAKVEELVAKLKAKPQQ